jgi:hypothetical protein
MLDRIDRWLDWTVPVMLFWCVVPIVLVAVAFAWGWIWLFPEPETVTKLPEPKVAIV